MGRDKNTNGKKPDQAPSDIALDRGMKIEEALSESLVTYTQLLLKVKESVLVLDAEEAQRGKILFANHTAAEIHGYTIDEFLGLNISDLDTPESAKEIPRRFKTIFEGGWLQEETTHVKKNGEVFHISISAGLIELDNHKYVLAFDRDISDLKSAERKRLESFEDMRKYQDELAAMTHEIAFIEERERYRIAAGVHDHLSQTLAFTKLKLDMFKETLSNPEDRTVVEEVQVQIKKAIDFTKDLTFELAPPVLFELGLKAALEAMSDQIKKEHNIRCSVKSVGKPEIPDNDIRNLLYRAVQELLSNTVKYASAHNVLISIREEGDNILVEVEDDGVGFAVDKLKEKIKTSRGFGLVNIRERLKYIGGRMTITSTHGRGTRVVLTAPVRFEPKI